MCCDITFLQVHPPANHYFLQTTYFLPSGDNLNADGSKVVKYIKQDACELRYHSGEPDVKPVKQQLRIRLLKAKTHSVVDSLVKFVEQHGAFGVSTGV